MAPRKTKPRMSDMDASPVESEVTTTVEPVITYAASEQVKRRGGFPWLLLVLVAVAVSVAVYFYFQYTGLQKDPTAEGAARIERVVEKAGRLIDLPKGELPAIATVDDVEALAGQPFFENAKEGNIVLFYATAGKAFLYDPVADIIVEAATVQAGGL